MSVNNTLKGASRFTNDVDQKLRSGSILFRSFILFFAASFLVSVYVAHDQYNMKMSAVWLVAKYKITSQIEGANLVEYRDKKNRKHVFSAADLSRQKEVMEGRQSFVGTIGFCALFALFFSLLLVFFLRIFLINYSTKKRRGKNLIRGAVLVEEKELIEQIEKADLAGDIYVGDIPIPRGSEVQHMFINGASGTGKGNVNKGLLAAVRARKQRFVVYDKSGEYVSKFYRKGYDIILNPFDERMPLWTPWHEIKTYYDCELLAASFIPREKGEKQHWVDAPRTVLADLLYELRRLNCVSVQDLMDAVFNKTRLAELLVGTTSEAVLNPDAPEQAGSVRAILAPKVRSFRYLPLADEWFSLRDWVRNDASDRCLFITTNERQLQSVKPLISAWIDTIISETLSLPEDQERRVFVVVDELASLDQIGSIKTGLFEGRKFGLSMILSVTSIEILKELYGDKIARAMVSMCATKVSFRSDEPESAEWLAKLYCEEDVREEREGLTMSDHHDSINVQDQRQRHQLLLPTEFMSLRDKKAVIKLGFGLPIAKINVPYVERETVGETFIERKVIDPLRSKTESPQPDNLVETENSKVDGEHGFLL